MAIIRKATLNDIKTLVHFQQQLAYETERITLDAQNLETGLKALFNDPSKGTYHVAEINNEVVGCFLITYEWSEWRNGMVYWLQSAYVKETHRGQGVFRKIYEHLTASISNDPHVIGLRLYVDKTNEQAQRVYDSLGMDGSHYTVYEWMK